MIRILAALALISVTGMAQGPANFEGYPVNLRQGVMAGEVGETSAILQSRLTSANPYQNMAWEGVRGTDGWAQFEYAQNEKFRSSKRTDWIEALPSSDFIVKTKVDGLKRATRYFYRLHYGPEKADPCTSETATFRTLAGNRPAAYSFAIVTGMNYSFFHHTGGAGRPPYNGPDKDLGYPALESILKLEPDFFVGTGDNVYYDHPGHRGRAQTAHEMRKKHHEQYSQQRFLDLFLKSATYWLRDDHDHRFNDSDPVNPVLIRHSTRSEYYPKLNDYEGESGSGFLPSHELGISMFREQLPVVDLNDREAVTYRTHRVSRDLQIWIVEGRDYRSPNDMPDGPNKTIWGEKQKTWLKRTLKESDATFKLLISATPMVGPDGAGKRDNHTNIGGFRNEGDEFFAWLVENKFDTDEFFITTGDRHWKYRSTHPSGFDEFSSGALVDTNSRLGEAPGSSGSTDPEGKVTQHYTDQEATGGFLMIKIDPDGRGARARFEFYDEKGVLMAEHEKRRNGN